MRVRRVTVAQTAGLAVILASPVKRGVRMLQPSVALDSLLIDIQFVGAVNRFIQPHAPHRLLDIASIKLAGGESP